MGDRGIAPGLLVASPDLQDPNFTRTVVLMVQHDADSSFGLVVNRPTGVRVSEAQESLNVDWPQHSAAELFRGGPLEPAPGEPLGFVLHYPSGPATTPPESEHGENGHDNGEIDANGEADPDDEEESTERSFGIVLYTIPPDPESLVRLEAEPSERVRFVTGYAQWAPGQLEMELLQGAWLVAEVNPRIIFETPIDAMWEAAVRSTGIDPDSLLPGSLVAGPEIH